MDETLQSPRADTHAQIHPQPAGGKASPMPPGATDCHAHIMHADVALAVDPHAKAKPKATFGVGDYLATLDAHGVQYAVLTAPSFYGTNNDLMLDGLAQGKGRLRGTATIDPARNLHELAGMRDQGVVGVRLNWVERKGALPDVSASEYQALFRLMRDLDMHVELHLEAERLRQAMPHIESTGVRIVLDHFGRPDATKGVHHAGFQEVLRLVATGNVWVKLSAPFRLDGVDAQPFADALMRAGGAERLVWATDWPWVRFEEQVSYQQCIDWLHVWVADEATRKQILVDTPHKLMGFDFI